MILTGLRRWAARLLLPLFLLVAAEPLRALDCAAHMGTAAPIAGHTGLDHHGGDEAAEGEEPDYDRHGSHAISDHEDHTGAPGDTDRHDQHDDHRCDCIGSCSTVAAVRIEPVSVIPPSVVAHAVPALPVELGAAPAARSDRLLPYANGPPTPT